MASIWDPPGGHNGPYPITKKRAATTRAENAANGGLLVTEQHIKDRARLGPEKADRRAAERLARRGRP